MSVRTGRDFLAFPAPPRCPTPCSTRCIARRGHLFRAAVGGVGERPPGSATLPHPRPDLHLCGQRPRRMGGGAGQRAVARRHGAGARERAIRARLGRDGGGAWAPLGDAARHLPTRGRSGGARDAAPRRQGGCDQGGARGAGRYGVGRGQRHRGDPQGDRSRRPWRAADGRYHRVARHDDVRDG